MKRACHITGRAAFLSVLCVVWASTAHAASQNPGPEIGQMGLLCHVHGYDVGHTILVPVRPLCTWLGAEVGYSAGAVTVTRAQRELQFQLGATTAMINGKRQKMPAAALDSHGIACISAPTLCAALGVGLRYVPGCYAGGNRPAGADEQWSIFPHLVLSDGARTGVVLVHLSPPDLVEQVIRDLAHTTQTTEEVPSTSYRLEDYGWDWILPVTRVYEGRLFYSAEPARWAAVGTPDAAFLTKPPGFVSNAWVIYGVVEGKWRLLTMGQDEYIHAAIVRRHHIRLEVLKIWNLQILDR
jgi:hypothetical protein